MVDKHEIQVAVFNADATHGPMPNDFVLAVKDIKLAILQMPRASPIPKRLSSTSSSAATYRRRRATRNGAAAQ